MANEPSPKLSQAVNDQDHIISGPGPTRVTIVEYGDYECQFCGRANRVVHELRERLGENVVYVYRHLPITSAHPNAQLAAEAAEAAAAQGKFWDMHEMLFAHQHALQRDDLIAYAGQLELDVDRFTRELDEHIYAARVREDFESGVTSGVNATPTFFVDGKRYDGPWDVDALVEEVERPLGQRVQNLATEFMNLTASGGLVLLLATVVALLLANSGWADSYEHFWEIDFALKFGEWELVEHLSHWVNDGLMAIFFFVVGLEIKREILAGELANPKRAALPVAGAIGGMVLPALVYVFINQDGPGAAGWGIPMATDIAFTLGILTVLGRRVPMSLKVFFTALAIADDLGAVLVIAIFYSEEILFLNLAIGLVLLGVLFLLNYWRIYSALPYAVIGVVVWYFFLESGVHPTVAGVLLALTIPTRSPPDLQTLFAQTTTLLRSFQLPDEWQAQISVRRQATTSVLEQITERMQSPARRLERNLHPWSTFLILPIFALANAGVRVIGEAGIDVLSPVSLGIIFGLVLGKPIGIVVFSWLAVQLRLAELPADVNWAKLFGASCLAGIGFTISLFIASAAFVDPAITATAKIAILLASVLAAVIGSTWLILTDRLSDYPEKTPVQAPVMAD